MSIANLILGVSSVTVSFFTRFDILFQNAIDFITKCDRSLLQNDSGFLLQNATILLQNATVITYCDDFVTKCNVYYNLRQ